MLSENYKSRFKAEFYQTQIRYDKLSAMLVKYEDGTIEFTPSCSIELLEKQKNAMKSYLNILMERANIEKIIL